MRGVSAETPEQIPLTLRAQGITTPEGANFTFYNPAPQGLKLPALRAEVDEPGRLRPRLFLLLFCTSALRPLPSPPPSPICLENPCWGSYSTQPFKRPHSGPQRQTTGEFLALPFSLYSISISDMGLFPKYTSKKNTRQPRKGDRVFFYLLSFVAEGQ